MRKEIESINSDDDDDEGDEIIYCFSSWVELL